MIDLLGDGKLGDGSWCNAPHCRVRLFAFVDVELGWAWRAYDLERHEWLTNGGRAGNEQDARVLCEEWVRAVIHDRPYVAELVWHRAPDQIILVCNHCGKQMRVPWYVWYEWERKSAQTGTAHPCSRPTDGVNASSGQCSGVLLKPPTRMGYA